MPDLKGFGENAKMLYPFSLDDYINDVKEYMYKKSIVRPCVVAHSFGGRIAIKASAREPRLFDKLVLTGSAGLKPKFSLKKYIKAEKFKILKKFFDKEKLIKYYSSDYLSLNGVMRRSFVSIVNEHLDDYAKRIKNQTLIINGTSDKETPVYMAKRLNEYIANSKLSLYKGAGHFAFIDKPIKFNTEVREFLLSE